MGKRSRRHSKAPDIDYNDIQIQKNLNLAISDVKAKIESLRSAARKYNLKPGTIRNRLHHLTVSKKQAQRARATLTEDQEAVLLDWIGFLGSTGRPLSREMLRKKVRDLSGTFPSEKWISRFQKRNAAHIRLRRPAGLDPKRARAFNLPTVTKHFETLFNIINEKNIPWENIYNMDEKGIQLGGGRGGHRRKFFFSRSDRANYAEKSGDLELVTVIESCCADGTTFSPGFVFSGASIAEDNIEAAVDGVTLATSENGWTSNFLCTQWFAKSFIPQAVSRNKSGQSILLIFDGHGSHVTDDMVQLALENGVELYCLPPHTTHKLQPLDVGVFGPVQHAWGLQCDDYVARYGVGMQKQHVVREYMAARLGAFTVETVKHAWEKAGVRERNGVSGVGAFDMDDFAPSLNTSTHTLAAPTTFPLEIPSDFDPLPGFEPLPENDNDDLTVSEDDEDRMDDEDEPDSEQREGDCDDHQVEDVVDYHYNQGQAGTSLDAQGESQDLGEEEWEALSDAECWSDGGMAVEADNEEGTDTFSQCMAGPHPETPPFFTFTPLQQKVYPSPHPTMSTPTPLQVIDPLNLTTSLPRRTASSAQSIRITRATHVPNFDTPRNELINQILIQNAEIEALRSQRNHAEAHGIMALQEVQRLKHQLNNRSTGKRRQNIKVNGELLTGEEARAQRDAENAAKAAKEQEKQAAAARRATRLRNAATRAQEKENNPNFTYRGTLKSQKREDLLSIVRALGLPTSGTKAVLVDRLETYFHAHPEEKEIPLYRELFAASRRRGGNASTISSST